MGQHDLTRYWGKHELGFRVNLGNPNCKCFIEPQWNADEHQQKVAVASYDLATRRVVAELGEKVSEFHNRIVGR